MGEERYKRHAAHYRRMEKLNSLLKDNLLTFIIIMGVVLGMIGGIIMRAAARSAISDNTARYLGFPGDVLIRMLKYIATPLIVTCIICALGGMNIEVSKTVSWQIIVLLFSTKAICVSTAMVLTVALKPGKGGKSHEGKKGPTLEPTTIPDIFMDMFRNIIPNNIISVYVQQFKTKLKEPEEYTDNHLLWPFEKSYQDSINLLGAISVALVIGICLTIMKIKGQGLLKVTREVYEVSMQITLWILWTACPFLFFLVMTEIMKIDDLSIYFSTWGLFIATVLLADLLVIIFVDPLLVFLFTRSNPFIFYADMLGAYFTAIGTASSLGTMPVLIECLLKHGVDERMVRFVVPIVVNINKDGASVYFAVSSVFAAQLMSSELGVGEYLSIFVLSTMGSIAAAGVPFSGPLILLMILNALGLDQTLVGTFLAIDWIPDRGSTVTNIISNSVLTKVLEKWNSKLLRDLR